MGCEKIEGIRRCSEYDVNEFDTYIYVRKVFRINGKSDRENRNDRKRSPFVWFSSRNDSEKEKERERAVPGVCRSNASDDPKMGRARTKERNSRAVEAKDCCRTLQGTLFHEHTRNSWFGEMGYTKDITEMVLEKNSDKTKSLAVIQGKCETVREKGKWMSLVGKGT